MPGVVQCLVSLHLIVKLSGDSIRSSASECKLALEVVRQKEGVGRKQKYDENRRGDERRSGDHNGEWEEKEKWDEKGN